jgi:hypothetical protein
MPCLRPFHVFTGGAADECRGGLRSRKPPRWKEEGERVPDLVFVLLTVGLFAALTMAVRAVERL